MKDSQYAINKAIKDVESWGILTLMCQMFDTYIHSLDNQRDTIAAFQTQPYKDSPLENIDRLKAAFEAKYDEEFTKIYNQKEKEYEQQKASKNLGQGFQASS